MVSLSNHEGRRHDAGFNVLRRQAPATPQQESAMTRLDQKLANIRAGRYTRADFIIADAKDPDMGPSIPALGPKREADGSATRFRTRAEFLEQVKAIVAQDILDVMLVSASNLELLVEAGVFRNSAVKPAIRANDATDIWFVRGNCYTKQPSRPFRTASLPRVKALTDLGLYSVTFNNDLEADVRSLEAFAAFRAEAASVGFKYFLEVFNPNVDTGIPPEMVPFYVNDCIARCLAGVVKADRPQFLKVAYNGPKAMEELTSYDPGLIVGVLGGSAGTTRDTFELLSQAERFGARVALFGRKINLAESPLDIVRLMRQVVDGAVAPLEAVKAYHGTLQAQKIKPARPLEEDSRITEAVLKQAA
jgi:DhnA family fructose-bisphosphate aldolase class Ia